MAEIKTFGRWNTAGIQVVDPGLIDYISLKPVFVPRTGARYAKQKFYKSKTFIVERLITKLMVAGHKGKKHKITSYPSSGKGFTASKLAEQALSIIEQRTKQNPIKVLVEAVENAAPREEIVSIEYGGARYPKAVECAPQRRIDIAFRYMIQGAFSKSFNSKKPAAETLAEEILSAHQKSPNSFAISRKLDIERQADASR